ncbi:MAG: hypothetical protein KC421_24685 [Anaerolineales bacterium]|nr:hypothetical protein [Anaerolineales bacterium]
MDVKKITGFGVSNEEFLRDTLRKLSFFSTDGAKGYREELMEHLIMNVLARFDPAGYSPGTIREKLREMVGFDVDYEQVKSICCRLVEKKKAYATGDVVLPHTRFGIDSKKIKELTQKYKDQEAFEEKIVSDWCNELTSRYPKLTQEQISALVEDLQAFSLRLYSQHSVESAALYSGSNEYILKLLDDLDVTDLSDILPYRELEIHQIRSRELPNFFHTNSLERKQYIGQQLNQVFLLHMMQLDPAGAQKLAKEIEGGFLILDTNVLIRLFGLDGPELQEATIRLLDLSRGLKYIPLVTPKTIEEYKQKINSLMHNSRYYPRMNREEAVAALTYAGVEELSQHYWRKAAIDGVHIDPASVYEPYLYVDPLLKEYGVEKETEVASLLADDDKQIAVETSLLKSALDRDWKFDAIPEHDAFHRLLILRLRGGHEEKSPLETVYWFLTSDTKLRKYDRIARSKQRLNIPFCVLTSQWMQLLYPYRSMVDGFEATIAETLDSPLFRLFPSPTADLIHEIVSHMHKYESLPESVVTKAIADHAFVKSFADEISEEQKQELVEEYILGELGELETQLRAAQDRENELKIQLEEIDFKLQESSTSFDEVMNQFQNSENRRIELEEKIEQITKQSETLTTQLIRSKEQQDKILAEKLHSQEIFEGQVKKLEQKFSDQVLLGQKQLEQQRAWKIQTTKVIFIALIWIGVAALFVATNPFQRDDDLRWLGLTYPVVALVISQFILAYGHWPSQLHAKLLFVFLAGVNVVALSIAILKPFGMDIDDSLTWGMSIASLLTGLFEMFAFQNSDHKTHIPTSAD